jgi:hypothetical protein
MLYSIVEGTTSVGVRACVGCGTTHGTTAGKHSTGSPPQVFVGPVAVLCVRCSPRCTCSLEFFSTMLLLHGFSSLSVQPLECAAALHAYLVNHFSRDVTVVGDARPHLL